MPRRAPKKITAWSYSRLTTYQQCPAKLRYSALDRIPIKENDAMRRGQEIHKEAELYITSARQPSKIPESLELFEEEFKAVRKLLKKKGYRIFTEQQWAFTKDWTPCDWFARNCWVRVVVDLGILNENDGVLTIIDHKTGKARDDHKDQLKIYGTAGFAKFPAIEQVQAGMWYLDQGFINDDSDEYVQFEVDELDGLIKHWNQEVKPLFNDRTFAPRPNNLCSWCDYSAANGGPCKY